MSPPERAIDQKSRRAEPRKVESGTHEAPIAPNSVLERALTAPAQGAAFVVEDGGRLALGPSEEHEAGIESPNSVRARMLTGAPAGAEGIDVETKAPKSGGGSADAGEAAAPAPTKKAGGGGSADAGKPAAPSATKKAGVESFEVHWAKDPHAGPAIAKLQLGFTARFTEDATHDPALAEFRQRAFYTLEITAGPNKQKPDTDAPIHDDGYSRADDIGHQTKDDLYFSANDNPGITGPLDGADVIDYSFTAEQVIIDTSLGDKVIAKRGPHTATIKGKDPRVFRGVPKHLS